MTPFNRRDFLRIGGAAVSLTFLAPRLVLSDAGSNGRILVILQLVGGNDSVNTVIPYADPKYRQWRPLLAIPDAEILKVDSRLGLHPSMGALAELYQRRRFAFVNNVGFPTLDRSHFHCQDVWQTADENHAGAHGRHSSGWLGRYADLYLGHEAHSLTALSIGNRVPLGMAAETVIPAAITSAATYQIQTDPRTPGGREPWLAAIRGSYEHGSMGHAHGDLDAIRMSGAEMFESIDLLETIPPPSETAGYPDSSLGRGFQLVSQVLAANLGTRVVWISTGGYDTHSTQGGMHANLLADLSGSLAAFQADLEQRRLDDRVVVMGWSEFGRRVQENASSGTDHGKAGTMFLMGNHVKGGAFYGEVPDLGTLDQGDLPTQIDFRSVYWTLIDDWLGHDPEPVLMGRYENLGFIGEPDPVARRRAVRR
ncbi:MAG TPA: DUF1501 domain-containing protein [Thermoanaerobaculia bacterium]|nr:DUF1501 domain-containing protein [Thermoanaerobaculia bacterium]